MMAKATPAKGRAGRRVRARREGRAFPSSDGSLLPTVAQRIREDARARRLAFSNPPDAGTIVLTFHRTDKAEAAPIVASAKRPCREARAPRCRVAHRATQMPEVPPTPRASAACFLEVEREGLGRSVLARWASAGAASLAT